jgi:hypothetical protein
MTNFSGFPEEQSTIFELAKAQAKASKVRKARTRNIVGLHFTQVQEVNFSLSKHKPS